MNPTIPVDNADKDDHIIGMLVRRWRIRRDSTPEVGGGIIGCIPNRPEYTRPPDSHRLHRPSDDAPFHLLSETNRLTRFRMRVIVNDFTIFVCGRAAFRPELSLGKNGFRVPHRTVRRVHVMPWATPVRRIGLTGLGAIEPDGDSAGAGSQR